MDHFHNVHVHCRTMDVECLPKILFWVDRNIVGFIRICTCGLCKSYFKPVKWLTFRNWIRLEIHIHIANAFGAAYDFQTIPIAIFGNFSVEIVVRWKRIANKNKWTSFLSHCFPFSFSVLLAGFRVVWRIQKKKKAPKRERIIPISGSQSKVFEYFLSKTTQCALYPTIVAALAFCGAEIHIILAEKINKTFFPTRSSIRLNNYANWVR